MKLKRSQWIAVMSTIVTAILALVTNYATANIPQWLQHYPWLPWLLVLLSILALVVITVLGSAADNIDRKPEKNNLDDLIAVVHEAEQVTTIDPQLANVDNRERKLRDWHKAGKSLANLSGITLPIEPDKKARMTTEQKERARLLINLAKLVEPAFSRWIRVEQLIDVSGSAYVVAKTLSEWNIAARRAYAIALRLYYDGRFEESAEWTNRMEENREKSDKERTDDELYFMFCELKALIARDFKFDRDEAREYLGRALSLSEKSGDDLKRARICVIFGGFEERAGNLDLAVDWYQQALESVSHLNEYDVKTDCYRQLGVLALGQGRYENAHEWYKQLLDVSRKYLRPLDEVQAYEGIAKILRVQGHFKEAYWHARSALEIQQNISSRGREVDELKDLIIRIADKIVPNPDQPSD